MGEGEAVPPATLQSLDVDPRFLEYDSDTHAEMLALGLQMRKHTTAKALIDARWVKWGGGRCPCTAFTTAHSSPHCLSARSSPSLWWTRTLGGWEGCTPVVAVGRSLTRHYPVLERVVRSTLGSRTRVNCVGSSPTHWVLTCTISEWHCESRARLYVCTYSYNRYCFNDDYLPTWFADDEKKHFRPQLPVDKDTVERIKSQFRDIAARPIKKVGGRHLQVPGRQGGVAVYSIQQGVGCWVERLGKGRAGWLDKGRDRMWYWYHLCLHVCCPGQ